MAAAEILPFTVQLSHDGAVRLTTSLAQAFAGGAELGPRESQIRVLGLSLRPLIEALYAEQEQLDACLPNAGPILFEHLGVGALLADLERLSELAVTYRAANTPDAGTRSDL